MKNLSRNEMKNISGGITAPACGGSCDVVLDGVSKKGSCLSTKGLCYCSSGLGSCAG